MRGNFFFKLAMIVTMLLMIGSVASAAGFIDVTHVDLMTPHGVEMASVALMALPSSISESVLNDLKIKYGKVKILTVTVEPETRDIDKISKADLEILSGAGVNIFILQNRQLPIEERLEELKKLDSISEEIRPNLTGEIIDEGERYQFVARRPDRGHVKMLLPLAERKEIDQFADKAVTNLIVGGDMDALNDGLVFMGVVTQLKSLVQPASSSLENA